MKKYYIFIDGRQIGPLTHDDVKKLYPKEDTLVWFMGLDNWTTIKYIPELSDCIVHTTYPILSTNIPTPPVPTNRSIQNHSNSNKTSLPAKANKKTTILIVSLISAILIISTIAIIVFLKQKEKEELEYQKQVEIERVQAEQRKMEAEQKKREIQEARETLKKIEQLKNQRTVLLMMIEGCQKKYEEAQSFHFLRTSSEKQEQLNAIRAESQQYLQQLANIDAELSYYGVKESKIFKTN